MHTAKGDTGEVKNQLVTQSETLQNQTRLSEVTYDEYLTVTRPKQETWREKTPLILVDYIS